MIADPLAYLHSAHAAAEKAAEAAAQVCGCHPPVPKWEFGDETTKGRILIVGDPHPRLHRKMGRRWNGSYEGMFTAQHIVANDPAAVLRRIAADRKQLELHAAVPDHGRFSERGCDATCDGVHDEPPVCRSCRNYTGDPIEAPCDTVEILAEGWGWSVNA